MTTKKEKKKDIYPHLSTVNFCKEGDKLSNDWAMLAFPYEMNTEYEEAKKIWDEHFNSCETCGKAPTTT